MIGKSYCRVKNWQNMPNMMKTDVLSSIFAGKLSFQLNANLDAILFGRKNSGENGRCHLTNLTQMSRLEGGRDA